MRTPTERRTYSLFGVPWFVMRCEGRTRGRSASRPSRTADLDGLGALSDTPLDGAFLRATEGLDRRGGPRPGPGRWPRIPQAHGRSLLRRSLRGPRCRRLRQLVPPGLSRIWPWAPSRASARIPDLVDDSLPGGEAVGKEMTDWVGSPRHASFRARAPQRALEKAHESWCGQESVMRPFLVKPDPAKNIQPRAGWEWGKNGCETGRQVPPSGTTIFSVPLPGGLPFRSPPARRGPAVFSRRASAPSCRAGPGVSRFPGGFIGRSLLRTGWPSRLYFFSSVTGRLRLGILELACSFPFRASSHLLEVPPPALASARMIFAAS